jgi:regulator of cell morphogenesis and NO signaling
MAPLPVPSARLHPPLRAAAEALPPTLAAWAGRPLGEIALHLVSTFHEPLRGRLRGLRALADRVAAASGAKDPRLLALRDELAGYAAIAVKHLGHEERTLFPWLVSGAGSAARAAVTAFGRDHDQQRAALRRTLELAGACLPRLGREGDAAALMLGLAELERDERVHVELEERVLFPRALSG